MLAGCWRGDDDDDAALASCAEVRAAVADEEEDDDAGGARRCSWREDEEEEDLLGLSDVHRPTGGRRGDASRMGCEWECASRCVCVRMEVCGVVMGQAVEQRKKWERRKRAKSGARRVG